jgi:hypothetical protein
MKTTDVFQGYPRNTNDKKNQNSTLLDDDDSTIGASSSMEINSVVEGIESVQSDRMELNSVVSSADSIVGDSRMMIDSDKMENQKKLQDIESQLSKLLGDVSSIMATVRKEFSK